MSPEQSFQSRNIDELYRSLGVWGRYQLIQFITAKLLTWPASNHLFSIWYLGYQPPLRCKLPLNDTDDIRFPPLSNDNISHTFYATCKELKENNNGTSCLHGYEYDKETGASTVTTEWDLVCEDSYLAQMPQTILITGQALGATLFTYLADKYGRKRICLISQWGMLAATVTLAFSPNVVVFLVLRFAIGTFQQVKENLNCVGQGLVTMLTVIPLEILPVSHRAMVHLVGSVFWSCSMLLLSAIGYGFQDLSWRHCQLTLAAVCLVSLIPNMLFLDESIRWLFANRRHEEALALITKACRLNKADETVVMAKAYACIQNTCSLEEEVDTEVVINQSKNTAVVQYTEISWQKQSKYTLIHVLRSSTLRRTAIVMFFGWINTAFTSFGLALTTHRLAGDRHLNYFLLNVTNIVPSLVAYFTMTRVGRRFTAVVFTATTAIALLSTVIINTFVGPSLPILVTALTILGTNTIGCVFGTLFQYTPELFPTNLRSIGVGIASTASRIGGMVGPFSNLLIEYIPWAPGTIYGCMSIIVSFLYMLLPETVDKELPQTIDEINKWKKNKVPTKRKDRRPKTSTPV